MKFMLLIVAGDSRAPQATEADYPAIFAQFQKLTAELQEKGKFLHSARLRPSPEARLVRVGTRRGRSVTDGPFTETKEAVGGYFMIDGESEAEAIEWAKKFPPFFHIEVRQVWEM